MKLAMKAILKKIGKTALNVVDHTVLGGAMSKTQGTDIGGKGQIPWLEVAAALIPIVLLTALFAGWIDISQLKELLKIL
tara:strand:- start:310 stop:546 length:237 start_codon:yes stop_codon:yes gene_type:complete